MLFSQICTFPAAGEAVAELAGRVAELAVDVDARAEDGAGIGQAPGEEPRHAVVYLARRLRGEARHRELHTRRQHRQCFVRPCLLSVRGRC